MQSLLLCLPYMLTYQALYSLETYMISIHENVIENWLKSNSFPQKPRIKDLAKRAKYSNKFKLMLPSIILQRYKKVTCNYFHSSAAAASQCFMIQKSIIITTTLHNRTLSQQALFLK